MVVAQACRSGQAGRQGPTTLARDRRDEEVVTRGVCRTMPMAMAMPMAGAGRGVAASVFVMAV